MRFLITEAEVLVRVSGDKEVGCQVCRESTEVYRIKQTRRAKKIEPEGTKFPPTREEVCLLQERTGDAECSQKYQNDDKSVTPRVPCVCDRRSLSRKSEVRGHDFRHADSEVGIVVTEK